MSAPATDNPSSISSSGHSDGLGRRLLVFDRETGSIRERLYLRPELSAFEAPLRRRVQLLASFDDERFARPVAVQRDPVSGELTVIAEFIAGSRLSDLIETAQEASWVPGVDVALGFLLEALPALSSFHGVLSISHGLIDLTRIAITPAGQVVLLDTAFGEVVERLMLSPTRLWLEFGLAAGLSPGRVRLDAASDLRQVALSAITLVLGRRLRPEDFPDTLPSVLAEVAEVAHIRGSADFAAGLQQLLEQCLHGGGGAAPRSDDLVAEVRTLVAREIGEDVCHAALVEFLEQMDAACEIPADEEASGEPSAVVAGGDPAAGPATTELRSPLDGISLDAQTLAAAMAPNAPPPVAPASTTQPDDSVPAEPAAGDLPPAEVAAPEPRPEAPAAPESDRSQGHSPAADQPDEGAAPENEDEAGPQAPPPRDASPTASARRRKRQQRSARERKDKLRSASAERAQPAAKQAAGRSSPWIVSPAKAAVFEPVGDPPSPGSTAAGAVEPVAAPPSPLVPLPVFPALPVAPTPAMIAPTPAATNPVATVPIAATVAGQPVPIAPVKPPTRPARDQAAGAGALRLKADPPPGFKPKRTTETLSTQPYLPQGPLFGAREPARFPTRLAVILLVIVAAAVIAGRSYLPARGETGELPAATPEVEPPVVVAPQPESGEIVVRSQPAGVRVLLDGKAVGETPLRLTAVSAGRHVLTFASAAGEVTRPVRVAAGETLEVEVPVFSGWLAVFAPVVLDVSLGGKSVGTTEQNRLMLPPGRHKVTLANRELGYRAVQSVEIRPGEVESLTIEPQGRVNLNAVPWAEVWLDGRRLGDTPIAGIQIPLGVREFVFRHPEHGERKTTVVVRADQQTAVSVDFTRPTFD